MHGQTNIKHIIHLVFSYKTFPEIEKNKLLAVSITRCKYSAGPL